ncbi:unnamed protein product, partial [Schistocephalus solidus]|uniref:Uncharacterized protein n=1 Tax=Schistocephalus solidus TaxID=70667 RepID=A0A183TLJ4_SCHSO
MLQIITPPWKHDGVNFEISSSPLPWKPSEAHADISNLLVEKNGLHKAYMDLWTDATKAAFVRFRRLVQQRLREMQDAWMTRKVVEIQGNADRNEMKNVFKAIKAIYGPCIKGNATLLSSE